DHPSARDAAEWLGLDDGVIRTMGLWDHDTSVAFLSKLQRAGAVRVIASRIHGYVREFVDGDQAHENTGHLVVEFPPSPPQRRRLFAIEARQARSLGLDPSPDAGQRYMFLTLD